MAKKYSSLLLVGILALVAVAGYGGYQYWQQQEQTGQLQVVEKELVTYKEEALKNANTQVLQAIAAKKTVRDFEENLVLWSDVIKDIRRTIPRDLVNIISYSGSRSGITMSVKTLPNSASPYFDVADLIASFDDADNFTDNFVPSIASGEDEEGREILTFSLSTRHLADLPEVVVDDVGGEVPAGTEDLDETSVETTAEEDADAVSR